ncbi:hypothetical protein NDN08_003477 [Rhodosorus marinus]|uniref:Protein-S-isoprenylcysteine O-methyltransferase n=1 Tax=Rhodosorus marinus TaxID=101924 RepID=A0AAV8UWP4_9RHOD|nr:hypothetical protein NDN08_003477 [Rhodosorus marinus]
MVGFVGTFGVRSGRVGSAVSSRSARVSLRRQVVRAMAESKAAEESKSKLDIEEAQTEDVAGTPEYKSEQFTTGSDLVERLQSKFDESLVNIKNIDVDQLGDAATDSSKTLLNNFLSGDWLQRGETYGFLQLGLALLLLRPQAGLDGLVTFMFGPILLFSGAFVCVKSVVDLGVGQLSIWPKPTPDSELRTDGIYGKVRHPIYSGVLISTLGYAVATGSPARIALAAALAYFFTRKIQVEEEFLEEKYGDDYTDYQQNVPFKLFPKVF